MRLVEKQLRSRHGHFMDANLLQSQFDDLEEPQPDENVLTIQLGRTPQQIVEEIKTNLNVSIQPATGENEHRQS